MVLRRVIPIGIYDIVIAEAFIVLFLFGLAYIAVTNRRNVARWKQDVIAVLAILYGIANTLNNLYQNYGWTWIARGSFAGPSLGLLFIIFIGTVWIALIRLRRKQR